MKNITEKDLSVNCVFFRSIIFPLFFKGISALVELPKNCVAAAVGKELSEYSGFLLGLCILCHCLSEIPVHRTLLELYRKSERY